MPLAKTLSSMLGFGSGEQRGYSDKFAENKLATIELRMDHQQGLVQDVMRHISQYITEYQHELSHKDGRILRQWTLRTKMSFIQALLSSKVSQQDVEAAWTKIFECSSQIAKDECEVMVLSAQLDWLKLSGEKDKLVAAKQELKDALEWVRLAELNMSRPQLSKELEGKRIPTEQLSLLPKLKVEYAEALQKATAESKKVSQVELNSQALKEPEKMELLRKLTSELQAEVQELHAD